MDKLPKEINMLIGDYLFDCRKNYKYINNKEYYDIYLEKD